MKPLFGNFAFLLAGLLLLSARAISAPPLNDDFANAIEMVGSSGAFMGTNTFATAEPGEPVPGPASVASLWWRWTAPERGDVFFNTGESLDMTVMTAVYAGSSVSNLIAIVDPFISSDLNASGSGSRLSGRFRANAGQTYFFRLSGGGSRVYGIIRGVFGLTAIPNIPANDTFIFRQELTGLTNSIRADNSLASAESGEPVPNTCDPARRTLWWTYTVPRSGALFFSVEGVGQGMILSLYEGESLSELELVGGPVCHGNLGLNVEGGEVYQIAVDGAHGRSGAFDLDWILYVPPPTDDFANRQLLQGTEIMLAAENRAATREIGEPGGFIRTLWYSWAAPLTGQAGYRGHPPAGVGAYVYTGETLESLVPVPLVQNSWLAKVGTVYHFQVDGQGLDFTFSVVLSPFPPPINDHFTNAVVLQGMSVNLPGGMGEATMEFGEPDHLMGQPYQSLWSRWQSPRHGRMTLDSLGLAPDVTVIVYRGNSLPALAEVARGTNQFEFNVFGGEEFYFAMVAPVSSLGTAILYGGLNESSVPRIIPGNLLQEASFENTQLELEHWRTWLGLGGYVGEGGGADGTTWVSLQESNRLWQAFPTQPGRTYGCSLRLQDKHSICTSIGMKFLSARCSPRKAHGLGIVSPPSPKPRCPS